MKLQVTELSEVCSVLRTYISQSKRVNKKNRLQNALKKLEHELVIQESKFTVQKSGGRLTFRKNNLCPHCHQPKLVSTCQ